MNRQPVPDEEKLPSLEVLFDLSQETNRLLARQASGNRSNEEFNLPSRRCGHDDPDHRQVLPGTGRE